MKAKLLGALVGLALCGQPIHAATYDNLPVGTKLWIVGHLSGPQGSGSLYASVDAGWSDDFVDFSGFVFRAVISTLPHSTSNFTFGENFFDIYI